jgi:hypothetical protein
MLFITHRLAKKNTRSHDLGYFSQFASSQPDNQLSCQTVKLRVVAFPAQQLSLYSSFPCTASQPQPKQTCPNMDDKYK